MAIRDINRTLNAVSPFITQLILAKKERERNKKLTQQDLERRELEKANQARQKFLNTNFENLDPVSQNQLLSELGIAAPPLPETLQASRNLGALGISGSPAAGMIAEGSLPGIPGTQISPYEQAKTKSQEALIQPREERANLSKARQREVEARIQAIKQRDMLRRKAFSGNKNTDQRAALVQLQRSLLDEIDMLDEQNSAMSLEDYRAARKELGEQLKEVRTELKKMGNVPLPEKKEKKKSVQSKSDVLNKMEESGLIKNAGRKMMQLQRKEVNRLLQKKSTDPPEVYQKKRKAMAEKIRDRIGRGLTEKQAEELLIRLFEIE